jgi:hypothetical protein
MGIDVLNYTTFVKEILDKNVKQEYGNCVHFSFSFAEITNGLLARNMTFCMNVE